MRICEICKERPAQKSSVTYKGKQYYARKCYQCQCRGAGKRTLQQRFDEYVIKSGGCWGWSGATSKGYGLIGVATSKSEAAHRVSYRLHVGPIPDGMFVCHSCDNPICANPEHLFLGSHQDNMRDMANKGRSTQGEKNVNAALTADDVLKIRAGSENHLVTAAEFGVSEGCVRQVRNRTTWKHV